MRDSCARKNLAKILLKERKWRHAPYLSSIVHAQKTNMFLGLSVVCSSLAAALLEHFFTLVLTTFLVLSLGFIVYKTSEYAITQILILCLRFLPRGGGVKVRGTNLETFLSLAVVW